MDTAVKFVVDNWQVIAGVWLGAGLGLGTWIGLVMAGRRIRDVFRLAERDHHEDQGTNWPPLDTTAHHPACAHQP
ncbi:hypothetical protein [Novosphingobium sp. B1]|uniref:hypothetical protein n=1 Tax=Novosphingobium sp. B1 TaxID=1938756 RepID=UPI0009D80C34|nr:hypothetical protein [Novosphingobium sp. B1]SMC84336.1 hypothetical protein SAMN06272759_108182 [Novosphingobium sp. B1]